MNKEQKDILNRVKLLMEYDMKNTSSENSEKIIKEKIEKTLLFATKNKNILNEASVPKGWEKFPCVPNHPKAKKISDTAYTIEAPFFVDGSTTPINSAVYKNNGAKYYKKGKTSLDTIDETTYKCNEPPFIKETSKEQKAREQKAQFDENGFLTIDAMNSLLSQYNQKINGSSEFDMPYVPCTNNDEVYAAYGLWFFQKVNESIFMNWYQRDEAQCKNDKFTCPLNKGEWFNYLSDEDKDKSRCMCYNSNMVYLKPFEAINKNNITSTEGRLDKSSIDRYKGKIPSFADIINTYGSFDLKKVISLLNKTKFSWYYGETKNVQPSAKITPQEISNLLTVITIATAFIPIAGPVLSIGFGILDATLMATWGKDPEAAEFMLILAVLPELSIAKNLFKSAKYAAAYKSLLSKSASGSIPKVLTQAEKELIEQMKQLDPSSLNSELQEELSRVAQEILAKEKLNPQLSYEQLEAVRKAAYGKKSYVAGDLILGVAPAFATKYGQDLLKRLNKLFRDFMSRNNLENLPPAVVEKVTKALTQAAETTPEESNQKQQMGNLVTALEKNPKEFDSLIKNEDTQESLKILAKNKLEEKGLEVLDVEDIESFLESIPD